MLKFGDPPIQQPMYDPRDVSRTVLVREWASWFKIAFLILFADQQSGTTAQRPTTNLFPGRPYFDTSLGAHGKKIWVDKSGSAWVDGTGASV